MGVRPKRHEGIRRLFIEGRLTLAVGELGREGIAIHLFTNEMRIFHIGCRGLDSHLAKPSASQLEMWITRA